jgi:hypothetical protein
MKSYLPQIKFLAAASLFIGTLAINSYTFAQTSPPPTTPVLPAVGTHVILGQVDGINIEAMVQSPSNEATPLQIICVFEYVEGDIYTSPPALPAAANGLVHVDKQLNGLLTDLRKSGKFTGQAMETLLITPLKGTIAAQNLLIIGLGNKKNFNPDLMIEVGRTGMREALRLGVESYAQASDLKDGGVDSPTAIVTGNMAKGAFEAYETDLYLQSKQAATKKPLTKVTFLAGQPFYAISGNALKQFIQSQQH